MHLLILYAKIIAVGIAGNSFDLSLQSKMNCPATTQQSLSKNKLDWLNTSISGSLTNKRSHMQRDAPSITQTLAHKYNAHHTHKHDQFTHRALYWSGYLLLESPAMAFQLSRERDKEKGRVKYRLANKYNHQCFFLSASFFHVNAGLM